MPKVTKRERDAAQAREFLDQIGWASVFRHLPDEVDELVLDRFWSKVELSEGHWLWTRALHESGVGQFAVRPRLVIKAHRLAWELMRGELEADAVLIREGCDQAACLNPDHHRVGTKSEAVRMGGRQGGNGRLKSRPKSVPVNCSQQLVDLLAAMHEQGRNFIEIHNVARRFGLGVGAVQHIIKGNAVGVR